MSDVGLDLEYTILRHDLAAQCAALELAAFPSADPEELLSEADILAHAGLFPEGFFVVMDGSQVVGQGAGILMDFDFDHPQHTNAEITGEHHCGNHDPNGDWYYGTDIAVDPAYRRRGIGRELYRLRKQLVVDLGKHGIIAGGYLASFGDHKHEITAEEYCDAVAAGDLYDRTLSFQLENGFEIRGILENYLDDEQNDGWAALIVWQNPEMRTRSDRLCGPLQCHKTVRGRTCGRQTRSCRLRRGILLTSRTQWVWQDHDAPNDRRVRVSD